MENIKIKELGKLKTLEIIGRGRNVRNTKKTIFLSKSGDRIFSENNIDNINRVLNKTELYFNKNNKPILTKKRDNKKITFFAYLESSFRGTTYIVEQNKAVVVSATGVGRIGEDTALVATIDEGGYVILFWGGRYSQGYKCFKNEGNQLKEYTYELDDEISDDELGIAKMSFGLIEFDEE